jgi:hypothetical protein
MIDHSILESKKLLSISRIILRTHEK